MFALILLLQFAYKNTYGIKTISEEAYKNTTEYYLPICEEKIKTCNDGDDASITSCADAFIYCNTYLNAPYLESGRNIYDVRKFGGETGRGAKDRRSVATTVYTT